MWIYFGYLHMKDVLFKLNDGGPSEKASNLDDKGGQGGKLKSPQGSYNSGLNMWLLPVM